MSAKYTIRRGDYGVTPQLYEVINPSGVSIAPCLSWRVARKIADALNGIQLRIIELEALLGNAVGAIIDSGGYCEGPHDVADALYEARAVSLQEEA